MDLRKEGSRKNGYEITKLQHINSMLGKASCVVGVGSSIYTESLIAA